jgi:hypothetical protein
LISDRILRLPLIAVAGEDRAHIPRGVFYGFCVATIGGPLALSALYVPGIVAGGSVPAWAATIAGIGLFAAPLTIWLRYSERVVSSGGLFSFVEAAAGRRLAYLQGGIWIVSYFLYLPYTIAYVVYDLLPFSFPAVAPLRPVLEVALPIGLVAAMLSARRLVSGIAALGVAQLILMLVLVGVEGGHGGPARFGAPGSVALASPALAVSLLYVCGSLPLFLGAEVEGGGATVRRGILGAFLAVSGILVLSALALAYVPSGLRSSEIPGQTIALAFSNPALARTIGLGAALSVLGLVGAEYLALSRLGHAMFDVPRRTAALAIGVPFVAADAVSLVDPDRFYDTLLRPSLIALYAAQVIVVLVYPLFRRKTGGLGVTDLVCWAVASSLMGYGLYLANFHPPAT